MDDFDSPWKEFLDEFFPEFLQLCFTAIHRRVDWSRPYESLDKELQQIAPNAEEGRRFVDKLYRVWTIEGEEEWVLIHVEVQNQPTDDFPLRMYVYGYRLFDRYGQHVVSLAVLGDDDSNWRPDRYEKELWGCRTEVVFPTVKLLDFLSRMNELEQSSNPAAIVILAHLSAVTTRRNSEKRLASKTQLVRLLYERGWDRSRVRKLFKFIDWLMRLPRDLAIQFRSQVDALQQEKNMPYVSSFEELSRLEGREEGREEGRLEALRLAIVDMLEARFGLLPPEIAAQIRGIPSLDLLRKLNRAAACRVSLAEVIQDIADCRSL